MYLRLVGFQLLSNPQRPNNGNTFGTLDLDPTGNTDLPYNAHVSLRLRMLTAICQFKKRVNIFCSRKSEMGSSRNPKCRWKYKDQPLELYPIPIIFHHFPVIFEEWNDSNSGILWSQGAFPQGHPPLQLPLAPWHPLQQEPPLLPQVLHPHQRHRHHRHRLGAPEMP